MAKNGPFLFLLGFFCVFSSAFAGDTTDATFGALQAEMARTLRESAGRPVRPYYLSYEVTREDWFYGAASFGTLENISSGKAGYLDIDLRLGSPKLDNTRRYYTENMNYNRPAAPVPLDTNPDALRSQIWLNTDAAYKTALEQLLRSQTDREVRVAREDSSDDFSSAPAAQFFDPVLQNALDTMLWKKKLTEYSLPFRSQERFYNGRATLNVSIKTRWFVNTEGARQRLVQPLYTLAINALTRADDGMYLPLYKVYYAAGLDHLPPDSVVHRDVDTLIRTLLTLRTAPVLEPFTGPALLSGRAAATFFHEILGHRLEGQRMKNDRDGQTFKRRIGEKILPDFLTVSSDPSLKTCAGADLNGYYAFDNQGVKAQKVTLIDHGVLKGFLMSRAPIEGFPSSNGHGRKQPGYFPSARQANLIAQSSHAVTGAALRALLIDKIKSSHKPYGLYFEEITGGFTMTGRTIPNAFNVTPVLMYRVFPDGRQEMVRGVDMIGTMSTLSNILATDDQVCVFNGICGAESGGVPVSAVSAALLIGEVEVQKKEKSQDKLPILPCPTDTHGGGL